MKLKTDTNDFYADLNQRIADELTLERLVEITQHYWNDTLTFQKSLYETELFNRLSTKRQILWLKAKLNDEMLEQRRIMQSGYDPFSRELLIELSEERKKQLTKDINRLNPKPLPEGNIGEAEIERAKAVPISELIEFKRKKARCLWHEDSNPSLYYYERNNCVKCFSCQAKEDSIGVMMKLHNITFIEAVKRLIA